MSDGLTSSEQQEQVAEETPPVDNTEPDNHIAIRQNEGRWWDPVKRGWRHPRVKTTRWVLGSIVGGLFALIGVYASYIEIDNRKQAGEEKKQQQQIAESKFRVLVPLQASSKEYLDFMQMEPGASYDQDGKNGEFSSKVAQNIRDSIKAAYLAWFALPDKKLSKEKIDFYFFPEGFDDKSYSRAFERALVEAHLAGRKVIALIGNASSSATQKYGEFCGMQYIELSAESKKLLNERGKNYIELSAESKKLLDELTESGKPKAMVLDSKISMLLPLATATSLTHSLRVDGVPAALRLPPANDRQAKFIADFLLKPVTPAAENDKQVKNPAAIRTIVVKDLSNPVYSEDLLEGFRENYVQQPLAEYEKYKSLYPDSKPPNNFGRILSVMSVGGKPGNLSTPFLYPMMTELKPEALVIFGMTNTSLETLAQVKASKLNFKYIILTDGAVDEYLISRIASMVDPAQLKNIYLTFPLPCVMPTALDTILQQKFGMGRKRDFELTHALYVTDSTFIVLSMLEKLAQAGWSKPAKQFVEETITEWRDSAKGSSSKAIIAEFLPSKRDYMIDHFGNTTNLDYHLYRVEVPKGLSDSNHGRSNIKWIHALEMCPVNLHSQPQQDNALPCMDEQSMRITPPSPPIK